MKSGLKTLRIMEGIVFASIALRIDVWLYLFDGPRAFTLATLINSLVLLLDIFGLWMMLKRKKATRTFMIASSVFDAAGLTAVSIMRAGIGLSSIILLLMDAALIVYLARSKNVRIFFVEPFSLEKRREQHLQDSMLFNPRTFGFWRNAAVYFCVFSVVGHWMEIPYCMFMNLFGIVDQESLVWDDPMYPFMVYGFGIIICMLLCIPLRDTLLRHNESLLFAMAQFYAIAVALSLTMELGMGLLMNQPVDGVYPLWDNSVLPLNILGQAWLVNDLLLGMVVLIVTWLVLPACQRLLSRFSETAQNLIATFTVASFALLCFIAYQ